MSPKCIIQNGLRCVFWARWCFCLRKPENGHKEIEWFMYWVGPGEGCHTRRRIKQGIKDIGYSLFYSSVHLFISTILCIPRGILYYVFPGDRRKSAWARQSSQTIDRWRWPPDCFVFFLCGSAFRIWVIDRSRGQKSQLFTLSMQQTRHIITLLNCCL